MRVQNSINCFSVRGLDYDLYFQNIPLVGPRAENVPHIIIFGLRIAIYMFLNLMLLYFCMFYTNIQQKPLYPAKSLTKTGHYF